VEKKVIPLEYAENLFQLHYTAITADGIQLAEYNEIIYAP
jgi:hypothetical protein